MLGHIIEVNDLAPVVKENDEIIKIVVIRCLAACLVNS